MNNRISNELVTLQNKETTLGLKLPKPYFIFVKSYGRSLSKEMKEICSLLEKTTWFGFNMTQYENEQCDKLRIEVGKESMLGKEYDGCILITLGESTEEGELMKVMEYIQGQKQRIVPVFSVDSQEAAERFKKVIELYQFCRVVEGEAYTVQEQMEILRNELKRYGFQMKDEAEVEKVLESLEWKKEELVAKTLRNVAKQMIYEKVMDEDSDDKQVDCEKFAAALNVQDMKATKRVIGFTMGGR